MTYLVALIAFGTFFITHLFLEKKKVPKWIMAYSLLKIIMISILAIGVSLIGAVLTKLLLLPVIVTIFFSSIISFKYRQKFEQLERGQEHV